MKIRPSYRVVLFLAVLLTVGCVTKKRKNEASAAGKFYHNTTAYYNGYWNATEILRESLITMRQSNKDDYNQILEVEDFIALDDPKMVKAEMDKILEKVSTVAQLHEPSEWVDDCYVMMAKAQYMKQEYETAEETLEYFQEDFNPANPYGRNYKSKKPTGKAAAKARKEEKKKKEKKREEEKKKREEQKEEKEKSLKEKQEERKKELERLKKEREKYRKEQAANRKKGIKTTTPPPPTAKEYLATADSLAKTGGLVASAATADTPPPPKPKKPEEDKTAYSEGLLWLAKTYIKRENWFSSEMLLDKLETSPVSKAIKSELPATFASLYIKQKRFDEAVPKLDEAIDREKSRQLKARYAFIAGQISQQSGNYSDAQRYFSLAKRYARDPKMEFMASMASAKTAILSGSKSGGDVMTDLLKMLREDKFKSVQDQIYFTIAEIQLAQNDRISAMQSLKLAVAASTGDTKLKAEAYYRIASIQYEDQQYLNASLYFDSTLTLLNTNDTRYNLVKKYVSNLKDIATNIELIAYQDTLLYFASLSEEEQQKIIPPWLKSRRKSQPVEPQNGLISKQVSVRSGIDFGNSSFFAYNKASRDKGKEDFDQLWGKRNLEDDWRRSSKASAGAGEDAAAAQEQAAAEKEQAKDKEEYEKFLRELPDNPVRQQEANNRIMFAMFTLGKLFRDKIENYSRSAETLEGMHKRYGPTPHEMDSYFYLYLDYLDLEKPTDAEEYKSRILRKFPDSKYAAILSDPDYFKKVAQVSSRAEQYYQKVYDLFAKSEHVRVIDAVDQSVTLLAEDDSYNAKLQLLRAMSLGNTQGKDAYMKALNDVISAYPSTPEQSKAKEMLRFLGGDNTAFASVQDVDKLYQRDETSVHYVAVITYDLDETRHINVKVAISEYNKKNYKTERLQLGDASLNITENSQVILIRKFENESKSMEYYRKVKKDIDEYTGGEKTTIDILPISQSNYRKMLSERSAASYRAFFESTMLDDKSK